MSFDLVKVVNAIVTGMSLVEKIKGAKGADKADAVVDATPEILALIESNVGRDILVDERVVSAERNVITAVHALHDAIEDVKAARV